MKHEGREVWAQRVLDWSASGLTAKDFAAQEGCNVNTLSHWKWRLRGEFGGPPKFVEVVAQKAAAAVTESWAFELVLRDGLRVHVPAHFEAESLRSLLSVLEGR